MPLLLAHFDANCVMNSGIIRPMQKLTVALVGKFQAQGIAEPLLELAEFITRAGHQVAFERDTAIGLGEHQYQVFTAAEIGTNAQLAIVVGGDGTMLGIARQLAPYDVPMVGINQGRLGFMTDISIGDMQRVVLEILAGQYEVEERTLLSASILRNDSVMLEALALNDVVVARGAVSGMVELTVNVDDRFMYSQRSDGLIVSTPTGSTAYALSAQGPILHPRLRGLVMVPIAPHSLSNRPIALPDDVRIEITITGGREVSANFDMQAYTALQHGDRITIERAPRNIRFFHPVGYSYFTTLRQKLHWNELPSNTDGHSSAHD
jgi:NAD+ kinase